MKNITRMLALSTSILVLAGCGPTDLGSPGANGDINIGDINVDNSTTNPPTPTPTPTGVVAADNCPDLGTGDALLNNGTVTGPTGTYRVCTLPSIFTASTKLPYDQGVLYEMNGRVDVGRDDGATADASDGVTGTKVDLKIDPGVILFGREGVSGGSYMIVNRGSRLLADGTPARPIIFTAETDVKGNAQDDTSAKWGGVVLLGRAPVADCYAGGINQADQTKCEMRVEGIANNVPFFGGNTPDDDSGILRYVQIRYSGFTLDLGSELQSLTLGGVGSKTVLDYIQSYNSSDDGQEFFGGHVNEKHYVAVGAEDDSIDTDSGVQANIQYAVVVQRDNVGDKALENDSPPDDKGPGTTIPNALPRTLTQVSNFSFWVVSGGKPVEARGAGDITLANGVIYAPSSSGNPNCVYDHGDQVLGQQGAQVKFYSLELDCGANTFTNTAVANGSGNKFQTNTLQGKYLNGANETNFTPVFDATSLSSFFDSVTYIGSTPTPPAGSDPWVKGWTCDSTTVSFGSGNSCKRLPVFN